ncbi:MAG: hypothetical protein GX601_15640, partial [Anaerolineales bacterium]|nr:hypothetical protein [Anaerolineales bacterium]
VTWQFTGYGQVHREFDAYYDWMHHGESYAYLYYLALADPTHYMDRQRMLRFAAMYTGDDPKAPNWDPALKMIRSPINGSRGPCFEMTAEDWVTHRPVLANYLSPYEDVPGHPLSDPLAALDWNDDETFARILALMNARMVPGDVPLNLHATSLVASAYLKTGEERYRRWVLDYLAAWSERTAQNGGIMPDNVGPTGQIGERMDGKWWGGYYGWRWPHGAWMILEATLNAGANATLLTGDPAWLNLHRSQADMLWSLRCEDGSTPRTPARYGDVGWFDYRPPMADPYVHLWFVGRSAADRARIEERFPDRDGWRSGALGWYRFAVDGAHPDYPDRVCDETYAEICRRLGMIEADDWDALEEWDVHHWQARNPVVPWGLAQMALGTPGALYHGGLLHASVRYFDPTAGRPGLPAHVAALVERVGAESVRLLLVNTDPLAAHDVVVQAGSFGEHAFTEARLVGEREPVAVDGPVLRMALGPAAQAALELGLARYVNLPTYAFPPLK